MSEERSRDAAWEVIDQVWMEHRSSIGQESELIRSLTSDQLRILFDLFWQSQFEDDRVSVQQQVSEWVDLLLADVGPVDET